MNASTISRSPFVFRSPPRPAVINRKIQRCRPAAVVGILMATDIFCLATAVAISVMLKAALAGPVEWGAYLHLWPAIPIFLVIYASVGLYSVIALCAPEEIRRVTISSAVAFVVLAALTVTQRGGRSPVTWTLVLAVVLTIVLIPLMRFSVRSWFGRRQWWGYPAVLFGSGSHLRAALKVLLEHPGGGLIPVAIAAESAWDAEFPGCSLPLVSAEELAAVQSRNPGATCAVVAIPGFAARDVAELIGRRCANFPKVFVLHPFSGVAGTSVQSRHMAGELVLEVDQHIYASKRLAVKAVLDRLLAIAGLIVLSPLFAVIALTIAIESGRPILFGHRRLGKGNASFRAWKFRTMVKDADEALKRHLEANPELRREWEETHKLRDDPRVSRVGSFLRRTSLDELPQLFNVAAGEMSIVGPRPIVTGEISKYGDDIDLYCLVKGCITGLWQVSGRNDTTYAERVALDTYYIRNWSLWLDLSILARTVTAVLFRQGAY